MHMHTYNSYNMMKSILPYIILISRVFLFQKNSLEYSIKIYTIENILQSKTYLEYILTFSIIYFYFFIGNI
jgi:hypothetical protein